MTNNNYNSLSSFFEDLSGHYDRFEQGHDFLRSQLLSQLESKGHKADRSVANYARSGSRILNLARYLSKTAAVAAIILIAFGLAMFNIGTEQAGPSTVVADNILSKITDFENVHFTMTTMGSSVEMWWQRPNSYRMVFSDGTVITSSTSSYSIKKNNGSVSHKPALETHGPEMMLLAELGEVFPFDMSPTQNLMGKSRIASSKETIFKGEACLKVQTENPMHGDILEYIIDKDQPMIYQIDRIRNGKVISHVEVIEIDSEMPESLFEVN